MLTTVERCPCSWCLCSPSPGRCPCISVRRGRTCPAPDVHTTATPAASLWEPALCHRDCSSCTDTDLYMKGRQEVVCWWVRMNRYFCGWVSKIVFIPLEAKAVLLCVQCVQCVHWVFCPPWLNLTTQLYLIINWLTKILDDQRWYLSFFFGELVNKSSWALSSQLANMCFISPASCPVLSF